jgi:hypothetical protein
MNTDILANSVGGITQIFQSIASNNSCNRNYAVVGSHLIIYLKDETKGNTMEKQRELQLIELD